MTEIIARLGTHASPTLKLDDLFVSYRLEEAVVQAVRSVSLELHPGEVLGLVGESGSGKSTVAYAVLGGLEANGFISGGRVLFEGTDLSKLSREHLRSLLGARIALVPQEPATALNPTRPVGDQIAEVFRTHMPNLSSAEIDRRVVELLANVRLPDPQQLGRRYPHQLSGGQQQRIAIAMAFACDPTLLIMDEPTTGLDVTTEARILDLIADMAKRTRVSVLYITHNLGVVAKLCSKVAVMYSGQIVETGNVDTVLAEPQHPYTAALLACIPKIGATKFNSRLAAIDGSLPNLTSVPSGCIYASRCAMVTDKCVETLPPVVQTSSGTSACWRAHEPIRVAPGSGVYQRSKEVHSGEVLSLVDVRCEYGASKGLLSRLVGRGRPLVAVRDVSLGLQHGETLALIGESGSGKTTLARAVVGLAELTSGSIQLHGKVLPASVRKREVNTKRRLQMVFQNPDGSLNPQWKIGKTVARPLVLAKASKTTLNERVTQLLSSVQLQADVVSRFPHQLSGGQKQRVGIARTFAAAPEVVILDEPLSALDVSVQAAIVNVLIDLQQHTGCSYLFISHDLSLVLFFADRIAVMYGGELCEIGTPQDILSPPYHPYTEALLSAIPIVDISVRQRRVRLNEGATDSSGVGCPLASRCHKKFGSICDEERPPQQHISKGHKIVCHWPIEKLALDDPVITSAAHGALSRGA